MQELPIRLAGLVDPRVQECSNNNNNKWEWADDSIARQIASQ